MDMLHESKNALVCLHQMFNSNIIFSTFNREKRVEKRSFEDDENENDEGNYIKSELIVTPEPSKRCKPNIPEHQQTPHSQMVPTGELFESTPSFNEFYDPNFSNSPYLRFAPNYSFPYTPTTSSTPLTFAAAVAASRYSSPYYQYPNSS